MTTKNRDIIIGISITVGAIILVAIVANEIIKMRGAMDLADKWATGQITESMYCDSLERLRGLSTQEKVDCVRAYLR